MLHSPKRSNHPPWGGRKKRVADIRRQRIIFEDVGRWRGFRRRRRRAVEPGAHLPGDRGVRAVLGGQTEG